MFPVDAYGSPYYNMVDVGDEREAWVNDDT